MLQRYDLRVFTHLERYLFQCDFHALPYQHDLFWDLQAIVTEEDGMESMAHRFLSAALKVRSISMKNQCKNMGVLLIY